MEALEASPSLLRQARVEVREDRLFFELARPNSRFDVALTSLDWAVVREVGDRLIGTGPYVPTESPSNDEIRLVSNPHYRHPILIPELRFKIYPPGPAGSPRALLSAIERAEVDFTNVLAQESLRELRRVRKVLEPGNSTAVLQYRERTRARDAPGDRDGGRPPRDLGPAVLESAAERGQRPPAADFWRQPGRDPPRSGERAALVAAGRRCGSWKAHAVGDLEPAALSPSAAAGCRSPGTADRRARHRGRGRDLHRR